MTDETQANDDQDDDVAYIRVDGLTADEIGEDLLDVANDVFNALRETYGDAVDGVVPVFNEQADPNLVDADTCAEKDCERPVDHRIHGVVIDGATFEVPTCGGHGRDHAEN